VSPGGSHVFLLQGGGRGFETLSAHGKRADQSHYVATRLDRTTLSAHTLRSAGWEQSTISLSLTAGRVGYELPILR